VILYADDKDLCLIYVSQSDKPALLQRSGSAGDPLWRVTPLSGNERGLATSIPAGPFSLE